MIVGDFNTQLLSTENSPRKEGGKGMHELNNIINQMDLGKPTKHFTKTLKIYAFFLTACGTFSKSYPHIRLQSTSQMAQENWNSDLHSI